jgi:hypothetical protein
LHVAVDLGRDGGILGSRKGRDKGKRDAREPKNQFRTHGISPRSGSDWLACCRNERLPAL